MFDLLGRLGFSPRRRPATTEVETDGAGVAVDVGGRELIELRTCPLLDVATEFPDVICQAHHGLIDAAYTAAGESAEGVELIPFAAPGACHVLLPRFHPRSGGPLAADEGG